jgi:hypothetical protein
MGQKNEKALGGFFKGVTERQEKKQAHENARLKKEAAEAKALQRRRDEHRKKLRESFSEYFEAVEPIIQALEKLPPRDGREFFPRVDLNLEGYNFDTGTKGPEISMWILYTREAGEDAYKQVLPPVHGLAMDAKNGKPEDVRLEINELPVLRVRSKPMKDGAMKITAHHYVLDYEYSGRNTRGSGCYRTGKDGNMYREVEHITNEQDVASMKDLAAVIGGWVAEAAPERLDDVRAMLEGADPATLKEKIAVSKPITFKKPAPGP